MGDADTPADDADSLFGYEAVTRGEKTARVRAVFNPKIKASKNLKIKQSKFSEILEQKLNIIVDWQNLIALGNI